MHSVTLNFAAKQLHLKLSFDLQLLADKQSVLQSLGKVEKQQLSPLNWLFVFTLSCSSPGQLYKSIVC